MNSQTQRTLVIIMLVAALGLVPTPDLAYSAKNPQAECIKGQNEGFIGKEQKGEAYEHSKDSCQTLSK